MPRNFARTDRIASVIHHELAKLIEFELQSSEYGLITITGVEVTRDLSIAKVYLIIHDEKKLKEAIKYLNEIANSLRFQLGKSLRLRKTPALHFYPDKSIIEGSRISELLNQL